MLQVIARATLLACVSGSVTGCASMVTAWKNDPLQSYLAERPSVYAMTGDRRTAVLMAQGSPMRFCAESLPDAVAAYSAASEANAGIEGKGTAGFKDATYAGLLQTFQRTEIAEVYRQMGWNLCLAWAQGAITNAEYLEMLKSYVSGGVNVIETRAKKDQVFPTIAPGSLFIGPGAAAAAQPAEKKDNKADDKKKPPEDPATVTLSDGVSLMAASTPSGYCIKAAADYVGDGTIKKPKKSDALPLCT